MSTQRASMKTQLILLLLALFITHATAQEIHSSGEVHIDKHHFKKGLQISASSTIKTGKDGKIRFNIKKDAFLVQANSEVIFKEESGVVKGFRLLNGAVLAVFGKGKHREIKTVTATAGIRGTAFYIEQSKNKTYFCNCYGKIDFAAADNSYKELLIATHHAARQIELKADKYTHKKAGMHNHTDDELRILEKMVGRSVPFDKK